jgi:hypothetical protein
MTWAAMSGNGLTQAVVTRESPVGLLGGTTPAGRWPKMWPQSLETPEWVTLVSGALLRFKWQKNIPFVAAFRNKVGPAHR